MTDTPAEVHIVVVHAVPGFTALPEPTVSLLSERTRDSGASVSLIVDLMSFLFTWTVRMHWGSSSLRVGLRDAFEERFASAIAEARSHRKQHARSRAWLVTDAFLPARLGQETYSRELPEFAVSFGSVSEKTLEDLEQLADSVLARVTAALSIILGESKFPDIKRVAAANYSLRPGYPGPTYELRLEVGSPTLSISSPADEELIATLIDCIGKLPAVDVETALRLVIAHVPTFAGEMAYRAPAIFS
jgi:hypothetical protein